MKSMYFELEDVGKPTCELWKINASTPKILFSQQHLDATVAIVAIIVTVAVIAVEAFVAVLTFVVVLVSYCEIVSRPTQFSIRLEYADNIVTLQKKKNQLSKIA